MGGRGSGRRKGSLNANFSGVNRDANRLVGGKTSPGRALKIARITAKHTTTNARATALLKSGFSPSHALKIAMKLK